MNTLQMCIDYTRTAYRLSCNDGPL